MIKIKRRFTTYSNCWYCGEPAWVYEWISTDRRRKAVAQIAACSEAHAVIYFERYQSVILNNKNEVK